VDGLTATPIETVCVGGLILNVETALAVESTTLLAVTVTTVRAPMLAGAVYRPFAVMVPSDGDRLQVTVWFPVPETIDTNGRLCPASIVTEAGITTTEIGTTR